MKYRKAREIIDQVAEDLSSYDDEGLIDYSKLYKIIRRCNSTLGFRINPELQEIVHIKSYKGYLPEDFITLNYAFLCKSKQVNVSVSQGFQVEYKTLCQNKKNKCSPCVSDHCGDYAIYQLLDDNWTQYTQMEVIRINPKSFNKCATQCPNMFSRTANEFQIEDDGSITTTFENGHLYLNYMGDMEDEEGDLLVLDDPNVEPYYESELIRQILKTVTYNKDGDVAQLYGDAKIEAARAKFNAINYVNTWGYDEIRNTFQAEKKKLYRKFFSPILGDYC